MQITFSGDNRAIKELGLSHLISWECTPYRYPFNITENVFNFTSIFRPPNPYVAFVCFSIHVKGTFDGENNTFENGGVRFNIFKSQVAYSERES